MSFDEEMSNSMIQFDYKESEKTIKHEHKFIRRIKKPFKSENLMKIIGIILSENLLDSKFVEYYRLRNPSDESYLEKYAEYMTNNNLEGFLSLHGEDGVNNTIPSIILDIAHRVSMVADAGVIFNYTLCEAMEVIDPREDIIKQKFLIIVENYLKHIFGNLEALNIDAIFEEAYPKLLDTLRFLNDGEDIKEGIVKCFHKHFDFLENPVERGLIKIREEKDIDDDIYKYMRREILGI